MMKILTTMAFAIFLCGCLQSTNVNADLKIIKASWYGGGEYLSRRTANGERFNPNGFTAAHRTLPFGTEVIVTNVHNGAKVRLKITDRGPAKWTGRDIDLSKSAAAKIGLIEAGEGKVTMEIVK